MKKFHITIICFFAAVFSACVSTGDITVDNHRIQIARNIAELEEAIVPLEALGGTAVRGRPADITLARQLIVHMERAAAVDADFSGQLIAWSGRLAILEGRYSEAVRLHRHSIAVSPGNIPALILGIRLEGDPSRRLELIDRELALHRQHSPGFGELNIERGRTLVELNRFSEAVGAYDIAFTSGLNVVYNNSYRAERNRAWELRDTANVGAAVIDLLGRDTINWRECIALTVSETQLLRFITGGRNLSNTELFNRLVDRAFIPTVQDITLTEWPMSRPAENDIVTRAGAAWFLWHLFAEARADRGLLTRYSARFATGANPRSPIADVPPLSPFFDSILGCVETEFMSLPDGRNFRPSEPIRSAELLSILRRIND